MNLTIQYHAGNPRMCRIPELQIKPMPECEGGGWWIPKDQAAFLVLSANAHHGLVEALSALGFGGDLADEKIGWCGSHSTNPDHFQCEFCFAIHEDCTLIAHLGNCPIPLIRQSLKLTEI